MQQYVVPQFIDVEGKIIGPITARQFVIILVGAGGMFILFRLGNLVTFAGGSLFIVALVVLFGWAKIGGRAFHHFLNNFIVTIFVRRPLRIWQREDFTLSISTQKKKKKKDKSKIITEEYTKTPLDELALIVDTGGVYQADEEIPYGF
jgi:hypothetical protein